MPEKKITVLIAKVGLDGHDKGALLLCSRLRQEGIEVLYTGLRNTVEQVVAAALQEDCDVVGVSILSGSHKSFAAKILAKMQAQGIGERPLVMGGIIPDEDIPMLRELGGGVFNQSASFAEIVAFIETQARSVGR
jgi:methylmalonyl-CoA mutase, C-terminal domain